MKDDGAIIASPPPNMPTAQPVKLYFEVTMIMDLADPKHPTVEEIKNRLGDGPQYFDGVYKVTVRFSGQREAEIQTIGNGTLVFPKEP